MDELIFLLILAGIGVVLLVAMFTYYKHHKKIHDEIKDFNHHVEGIDDVLLHDMPEKSQPSEASFSGSLKENSLSDDELPDSFTASRQDAFDIDQVNLSNDYIKPGVSLLAEGSLSAEGSLLAEDSLQAEGSLPADDSLQAKGSSPVEDSLQAKGSSQAKGSIPEAKGFFQSEESVQSKGFTPADGSVPADGSTPSKAGANNRELVDGVYVNTKRVISNNAPRKPVSAFKKTTDTFNSYVQNKPSSNDSTPELIESQTTQKSPQKIKIVYDQVPEGVDELIISHTILFKEKHFSGRDLFNAFQTAGLSFGEMNIFHYPGDEQPETFALFSIANIVEPGTFNPQEAQTFTTPGVSMFMRLPTRIDSHKAYEKFIQVAQAIAAELDGELCDETRSQLTQQAISYKKEQISKLKFDMEKAEKLAGMSR